MTGARDAPLSCARGGWWWRRVRLNTLKILLRSTVDGRRSAPIPALGQHFSMAADWVAFYRRSPRHRRRRQSTGTSWTCRYECPDPGTSSTIRFSPPPAPSSREAGCCATSSGGTIPLFGFGPDDMDGQVSWKGRGIVVRHKPQAVVGRIQATLDRIAQALGRKKPVRPPIRSGASARGSASIPSAAAAWRRTPAAAWSISGERCSAILVSTLPTPRCFRR